MIPKIIALVGAVVISNAFAETPPVPEHWMLHETGANLYSTSIDRSTAIEGASSALLQSQAPQYKHFGALMQAVKAEKFRGKRVRLSGQVKTESAHKAWVWLRADREDGAGIAFDNMDDRPIKGTTEWSHYEVVLDIPSNAVALAYGAGLRGPGKVWVDAMSIEVVPNAVATTRKSKLGSAKAPMAEDVVAHKSQNLGFER